jgi:NAD/NADP octopine/nopaline dehydrogenase, alpha-helical domain
MARANSEALNSTESSLDTEVAAANVYLPKNAQGRTVVTVCGGGNAAHAIAAQLGARDDVDVNVLSTFGDEAARWNAASKAANGTTVTKNKEGKDGADAVITGSAKVVTNDASECIPQSDVIIFAVPAFGHESYLRAIKDHLNLSTTDAAGEPRRLILGAMPAEGGFDLQARAILGDDITNQLSLFGLETLPWAVRLSEYGSAVEILGTKKEVDISVTPASDGTRAAAVLQNLISYPYPHLTFIPCMLSLTLSNINSVWHPTITYGAFRNWDFKTPFAERPLFYEGVDEFTGDKLSAVSNEILEIKKVLEARFGADLTGVRHVKEWMSRSYKGDMADESSLQRMINTNKGYHGLLHPMKETEDGKWVPNFEYRYIAEDGPFGLIVTRGIAELAGVETPHMMEVLRFVEKAMGKTFFDEQGKLSGDDIAITRTPQKFGFDTIEDMMSRCYQCEDQTK